MGSDFSFVVVAKKENKSRMEAFINLYSDDIITFGNLSDNCLGINFPIDSYILKYLEESYGSHNNHIFSNTVKQFMRDNNSKAHIGCIYLTEDMYDDSNEICKYEFTAATSDMSFLFQDSISIKKWFIELSKAVDSVISYIDLEYNGNRIIFFNGKEIDIFLKGDDCFQLTSQEFCNAILAFSKSTKRYFEE